MLWPVCWYSFCGTTLNKSKHKGKDNRPIVSTNFAYRKLGWLGGLLSFLLWVGLAQANGGTVLWSDEVGGYDLTVTASPFPLRVGLNDISVLLGRQSDSQIVLDALVEMTASPVDHSGRPQNFPATHANATNKLYYAANVVLPTPGRWQLTVQVDGPEGLATTSFEVEAEPAQSFNFLLYINLIGLPLIIIVFLFYVFRRKIADEVGNSLEGDD